MGSVVLIAQDMENVMDLINRKYLIKNMLNYYESRTVDDAVMRMTDDEVCLFMDILRIIVDLDEEK